MADATNQSTAASDNLAVASNLDHADKTASVNGTVHATVEAHGGPEEHTPDPSIGGGIANATFIVSCAMLVLIVVMIWKKVPAAIAGVLDARIAEVRNQLEEASRLRKEAEALKAEYEAKVASAAKDAEAFRESSEREAAEAIEDAKVHAAELVVRRQKMAEDKIAAAERAAIAEIRARTVNAATVAAASLIAQNHDAAADATMVDQAIKGLGAAH